ncbi:MAG TPA: hypothetical protein VGE32_00260, partial [Cellvibrio sp.]
MNSSYPHGNSPVFYPLSHTQRGSSQLVVLGAIAVLGLIGLLLLSLAALSMFWKALLLLAVLAAAVIAGVQVAQLAKREGDIQAELAQAEGGQQLAQMYRPLLENYQHLLKEILPLWQRQTELAR